MRGPPAVTFSIDWLKRCPVLDKVSLKIEHGYWQSLPLHTDNPVEGIKSPEESPLHENAAVREHLECLRNSSFDPKGWDRKGYVLKGSSIRTDGRLLQFLAFKVKELQCVHYHRLAPDKMPNFLISPVGGTAHFLTEARNVFQSSHDVEELLTTDLDKITVLSLDLGTSCVVGASVSLPQGETPATLRRPDGKKKSNKKTKRGLHKPRKRKRRSTAFKAQQQAKRLKQTRYFDLTVKCRAVSQPTDKFANWFEDQKKNTIGVSTGEAAYVTARQQAETDLDQFYNHTNFWKHYGTPGWGAKKSLKRLLTVFCRWLAAPWGDPGDDQKPCRGDWPRQVHQHTWSTLA
ncbi:hypothetical protein BG005_002230 [Podila minutissima]|nr:hypothetical protein BG005_002230 [Podila minutissima]